MAPSTAESSVLPKARDFKENGGSPRVFLPFGIGAVLLLALFGKVLFDLAVFAFKTDVYSHILLIPFISGYLIWQQRGALPVPRRASALPAIVAAALGLLLLIVFFVLRFSGAQFSRADYLFFTVLPFCCFMLANTLYFLGSAFAKSILFPVGFFFFVAPFPDVVTNGLEIGSQHASAEVYSWFLNLTGATYFQDGRVFILPNMPPIEVAQECSGIRSSLVLFITSLIGGHMFLRSTWSKVFLALVVFPLGIFRNAFRIYTITMLSVHWNPDVINGPLHSRGGPIFFLLSLIPFFIFLLWLRKADAKVGQL